MLIHLNKNEFSALPTLSNLLFATVLLVTCLFGHTRVIATEVDEIPPPPTDANSSPVPQSPTPMPELADDEPNSKLISEKLWQDRPLKKISASIKRSNGDLPISLAAQRLNEEGVLFDAFDDVRPWMVMTNCEWDAPATRHLPLFFEEPNLERLGYTQRFYVDRVGYESNPFVAEYVQPIVSAVHFFGRIPFVPYIWGTESPFEPKYTLGVDRPGSPVPYREPLVPLSVMGTIYQAGAVCGFIYVVP